MGADFSSPQLLLRDKFACRPPLQGLYKQRILGKGTAAGVENGHPMGNDVRHDAIAWLADHRVCRAHNILIVRLRLWKNKKIFAAAWDFTGSHKEKLSVPLHFLPRQPFKPKATKTQQHDDRRRWKAELFSRFGFV